MTTKNSPPRTLKAQADRIAAVLKQAEKGNRIPRQTNAPSVVFGVVMDDKVLKVTMLWSLIAETDEAALSEYILGQMSEAPHQ